MWAYGDSKAFENETTVKGRAAGRTLWMNIDHSVSATAAALRWCHNAVPAINRTPCDDSHTLRARTRTSGHPAGADPAPPRGPHRPYSCAGTRRGPRGARRTRL
ncbi:hypothetical protein SGPA1_40082 [Streptomyces misionensis JCM 4497]